jgi:hypothetical protein
VNLFISERKNNCHQEIAALFDASKEAYMEVGLNAERILPVGLCSYLVIRMVDKVVTTCHRPDDGGSKNL